MAYLYLSRTPGWGTLTGRPAMSSSLQWGTRSREHDGPPCKDLARWIWLGGAATIRLGRGAAFGAQSDGSEVQVGAPDRRISKLHARLQLGPDGYTLRDEGSTNGTLVQGQRVVEPRLLRPGNDPRERLRALWSEHGGNVSAVARAMGKSRTQIYRLLVQCGIPSRPAGALDRGGTR